MLIFRGKLNWSDSDTATNEGVTVVIPLGIRVGDPIHMYWQWTKDAAGNTKANVECNGVVDMVLSSTHFQYYSDADY
ncbi:hypothetical protein M422DRAFT_150249 [Sphaerobolus stellatus SS14]|nr:hypothetical protein M422DRAFT_150249 [Sphaerobolus stellatus SS14]